jgi:bifunctional pyridoxal-dependent enzyme with beta-cystathionase and maltose regulon repressor activities
VVGWKPREILTISEACETNSVNIVVDEVSWDLALEELPAA